LVSHEICQPSSKGFEEKFPITANESKAAIWININREISSQLAFSPNSTSINQQILAAFFLLELRQKYCYRGGGWGGDNGFVVPEVGLPWSEWIET
jgi:hypothetical protein